MENILTYMTFIPVAGMVVVMAIPRDRHNLIGQVSLAATIDARHVPRETAAVMYLGEPGRSIEEVVSSLCVRRVERPDSFFLSSYAVVVRARRRSRS